MNKVFVHFYFLRTKKRAWAAAWAFAVSILATSPILPQIVLWLRQHNLLRLSLLVLSLVFLSYLVLYFVSQLNMRDVRAYLGIVVLLSLTALLMLGNRTLQERIHILEYCFLALLFFKAAKFSRKGVLLYGVPLLLTVALGWIDELWQAILPNRVYDIQDVCDNAAGGLVGIGFAWIRQKYGKEKVIH